MSIERTHETGTIRVKRGLAEMLKGGVIMDVVDAERARIAEDAGACAVMALERVPSVSSASWPRCRTASPTSAAGWPASGPARGASPWSPRRPAPCSSWPPRSSSAGSPRPRTWWGAAAGVGNGFGTAFLYRGLSSGRMGVVAPVSGVGAAVIPSRSASLLGERPAPLVWVGHPAGPAGDLAGRPRPGLRSRSRGARRWLVDGILAGLGLRLPLRRPRPGRRRRRPAAPRRQPGGGRLVIVLVATSLRQPWRPARAAARRRGGGCPRRRPPPSASCSPPARATSASPRCHLALPGVHRDAGRDRAPRARPPRPGSGSAAVRGGRVARGGCRLAASAGRAVDSSATLT